MVDFTQPEAFRHQYRLLSANEQRMVFVLPRWHLALIAASAVAMGGFLLLNPELFEKQPTFLAQLSGWGGVLAGVTLDGAQARVYLEFRSPKAHTRWLRPFGAFAAVRTRQVKDQHGLHNHWAIELVECDGKRLRVGYGMWGAVRKRSRDELTGQLSRLLGVPVEEG